MGGAVRLIDRVRLWPSKQSPLEALRPHRWPGPLPRFLNQQGRGGPETSRFSQG